MTYSPLTPRSGIETSRAIQNSRLSTTAEPRPAVARAKPASGPLIARQRHQPVAERRAGGAAAGDDVAERLGAHLDAEHPHPRDRAGRPRRAPSGSAASSENHAATCSSRPATRNSGSTLVISVGRAAEARDQRQDEEVDDRGERDDLDGEPDRPEPGPGERPRRVALDRRAARPSRGRSPARARATRPTPPPLC